jgi:hypothetical protein
MYSPPPLLLPLSIDKLRYWSFVVVWLLLELFLLPPSLPPSAIDEARSLWVWSNGGVLVGAQNIGSPWHRASNIWEPRGMGLELTGLQRNGFIRQWAPSAVSVPPLLVARCYYFFMLSRPLWMEKWLHRSIACYKYCTCVILCRNNLTVQTSYLG